MGLVSHCISKLQDHGFTVHGITMDGHATNLSLCQLLGAQMDTVSSQLIHPSKVISGLPVAPS